jgi:hypothetical protein
MNRTANEYESITRSLRVYADELKKIGLHHLVPWIYQVYKGNISTQMTSEQEIRDYDTSERIRYEVQQTYEWLKQDPQWIAANVPWRKALQAMFYKITKKLKVQNG